MLPGWFLIQLLKHDHKYEGCFPDAILKLYFDLYDVSKWTEGLRLHYSYLNCLLAHLITTHLGQKEKVGLERCAVFHLQTDYLQVPQVWYHSHPLNHLLNHQLLLFSQPREYPPTYRGSLKLIL